MSYFNTHSEPGICKIEVCTDPDGVRRTKATWVFRSPTKNTLNRFVWSRYRFIMNVICNKPFLPILETILPSIHCFCILDTLKGRRSVMGSVWGLVGLLMTHKDRSGWDLRTSIFIRPIIPHFCNCLAKHQLFSIIWYLGNYSVYIGFRMVLSICAFMTKEYRSDIGRWTRNEPFILQARFPIQYKMDSKRWRTIGKTKL
jgi:hypothetical protein